ncbi:MAG: DUF853 family protein [Clostridia bacterium]|nr:DUF853 family protein [Bacilli bacterium]MBR3511458.1 DUF853 family protein [Clostridia bacterium]
MFLDDKILIGKTNEKEELYIVPKMANRHGLITGASGSGKTVTLKVIAESFSSMGVPSFVADIKGDLAGTCLPGETNAKIEERLNSLGIDKFDFKGFPVVFWDVFGKSGHPIRIRLQDVGATILSRMLGLNETQEGVLAIVFKIAREEGYDIIDTKDLRLVLQYVADNAKEYTVNYGNVASQTVGTIQRSLLMLEEQGGNYFFGEPEIDIMDFFKTDANGQGKINILHAVELYKNPNLYACFLLWLLTTLNNTLPEVGDLDKPKMVFFFDEAHLLFNEIPSYILTQVVQVVKLIRSKGVGLYFISQSPNDIPAEVLAQLGNKVQHTLRAYTPAEQKVVKAVAMSYRANPSFDTEKAILELGTGEAIVSFLNEKGEPNIVNRATILPPQSSMNAIDDSIRLMVISKSELNGKYDNAVDNESAYEVLSKKYEEEKALEEAEKQRIEEEKQKAKEQKEAEKQAREEEKARKAEERARKEAEREAERQRKNSLGYKVGKRATRIASNEAEKLAKKVVKNIFKDLFKK